jgi:hypothetical protein
LRAAFTPTPTRFWSRRRVRFQCLDERQPVDITPKWKDIWLDGFIAQITDPLLDNQWNVYQPATISLYWRRMIWWSEIA